jgi:hypothetical protein
MPLNFASDDFDMTVDDLMLEVEEDGLFRETSRQFKSSEEIRMEIANEASLNAPSWARLLTLVIIGSMRSD